MIKIELTDLTVDVLVMMFDKYAALRGWESTGDNVYKVRCAIDFGISALYAEIDRLEDKRAKIEKQGESNEKDR